MTDTPGGFAPQKTVILEHYSDADRMGAETILSTGIGEILISSAHRVVPAPSLWRMTLTEDFVATVNRIEGRDADNTYTTDRGAGIAGGRTLRAGDGVYDIVIDGRLLHANQAEQNANDNLASFLDRVAHEAAHLATHEAGHVLLAVTGEDSEQFEDLVGPGPATAFWRKHLASQIDEHRIERMAALASPSKQDPPEQLDDSLQHLRQELSKARAVAPSDFNLAADLTRGAAVGVFRDIAYTTAKLGLVDAVTARRPDPLPHDWALLEPLWDDWSIAFHQLPAANERTTPGDLANTLEALCRVAALWLTHVGVDFVIEADESFSITWTKARY